MARTRRVCCLLTHPRSHQESSPSEVRSSSPTPSSPENHVDRPAKVRSFNDRSPTRTSGKANMSARRSEEVARWAPKLEQRPAPCAALKPLVTQETIALPQPLGEDALPSSSSPLQGHIDLDEDHTQSRESPPSRTRVPQLFLRDVEEYTNPHLVPDSNHLTLEELAHLVRLSKYQERKRATTRVQLQRSLVSTALSARLTRCGESAHRNLVSLFRTQDKKAFASLYKAVHDVRLSCMETRKYAMLEPDMESLSLQSPGLASSEALGAMPGSTASLVGSSAPFFNDISPASKESLLDFIAQLRNNPDYLATRLCSLNATELSALKTFDQNHEPIESVLPSSASASSRLPASNPRERTSILRSVSQRHTPPSASHVEQLLSFQRHDPLAALIHTCFANSAGPDSAEDRRRTDVWATALARLISERRTGNDSILFSVLNAWSTMRDWSGRSNMEWYLMKILEDGAFILDKAEDQNGTRFNLTAWTREDSHKSERFYERAVEKLFEILDDEDNTGIPEGLVELGNEILRKLDQQFVEGARRGLVVNWLFHVWLLEVMIHPETRGMMAEYHITDYGRQKILKNVALKAAGLVNETMSGRQVKPEIAKHIDNILARFGPSHVSKPKTRLLPARSLTSLRETVEVHPYLLISPADLVTMVNALFPEKRPQSAQSSKFRSRTTSLFDFAAPSQPMKTMGTRNNNTAHDGASIISTSLSSVFSDAVTSDDPLLEEQHTGNSGSRYSPPPLSLPKRVNTYEEDGFRLREAIHDMTHCLGQEVVQGTCHPCTERWAVLFISPDGNSLSTQMIYDPDEDENEDDERSPSSDTDEEDAEEGSLDLDKDYHQLRDSILKLVEDFEIPQEKPASGKNTKTFSNRTYSTLKRYKSRNRIFITEHRRENRERQDGAAFSISDMNGGETHIDGTESSNDAANEGQNTGSGAMDPEGAEGESVLVAMLKAASAQARAQSDFVAAHDYWRTLQRLNSLNSPSLRSNGFAVLLNIFSRGPRGSIRRSDSAIEEYDAWLVWLKQSQERTDTAIESMMKRLAALRDKSWYVMDVLNSNPYDHSSKIATALKAMGSQPSTRPPVNQKSAKLAFLYTTESQMTDMLSGGKEYGFWNKLSDDHSEKTTKWLRHLNIENFCKGEERIHRLGLEVDICINKLVGDGVTPAPELWTNDLYAVDRGSLDRNTPKERDWDDASSIVSDIDRRFPSRFGSGLRDLRSVSSFNMSQHSFDSGRFSFSRASGAAMSEALDSQSYFGASSPVHTIDSTVTYWSQFQSAISTQGSSVPRPQSPTTSFTSLSGSMAAPQTYKTLRSQHSTASLRPGTSASSNETVLMQRLSEEKTRFLARLRQTLTSLLLSDLGNLVFARGSESDLWFRDLGQRCIKHRDSINRQQQAPVTVEKRRSKEMGGSRRAIEKKRSFENLRKAGEDSSSVTMDDGGVKLTVPATSPGIATEGNANTLQSNTTATDSTPTSATLVAPLKLRRRPKNSEFPFTKAYQRLLRMFCVHPNPMVKLDALYELEQLIIASLTSSSRKRPGLSQRGSSGSGQPPVGGSVSPATPSLAKPLEKTIDNVKERRSHTMSLRSHLPPSVQGNTDAIVNVLCTLFRDAAVRPKTLFRDLQFIASFVPGSVLDQTEKGMAFWNVGLAALLLKQEVCGTIVEMADEILKTASASNTGMGMSSVPSSSSFSGTGSTSSGASGASAPVPSPFVEAPTKKDAERMWIITAKEGHPTAQRELALFYLIEDPSEFDVEKATLPLSKISGVLRQQVLDNYATSRKGGESGTKDPVRMCLAIHWAAAAAEGGDGIARDFIKQQDDQLGLAK